MQIYSELGVEGKGGRVLIMLIAIAPHKTPKICGSLVFSGGLDENGRIVNEVSFLMNVEENFATLLSC